MLSLADIAQMADVIHRVVFLLFLLCFKAAVRLFFCQCSATFYFSTETTQTRPPITLYYTEFILLFYTDFAHRKRLSKLVNASYAEQAVGVEPVKNGKNIVNQ